MWTREGFKSPDEAAALGDTASEALPYLGGYFWVFGGIAGFLRALEQAPQEPIGSLVEALVALLVGAAAAVRQPWGWYVLLVINVLSLILMIALIIVGISVGGDLSGLLGIFFGIYGFVSVLWFIYFYKRRSRFGARARWKWLERTFPRLVGPEEKTPTTTPQTRDRESDTPGRG